MARLHYNGVSGSLGGSLTNSATSVTFASALTHSGGTNVPTISGGDYLPLSILDSGGTLSEIVYLTAYTSGATTGTITRGQEGTTGVSHTTGMEFTHAAVSSDLLSTTDVTTIANTAAANAALLTEYGQLAGDPKPLWKPAPARSTNLFTVANLYQGSTLGSNTNALNKTTTTPSVTANGTNQNLASRIVLPQGDNVAFRYRLTFTVSTTGFASGNDISMIIGARDGSFNTLSGTTDITVINVASSDPTMSSYKSTYEVDYNATTSSGTNPTYLDVTLIIANNVTGGAGGSITINSMDLRQIEWTTPAIWAGWDRAIASGAHFIAEQPIGTRPDGVVMRGKRDFGPDSTLDVGLISLDVRPETSYQNVTYRKVTGSIFGNNGPQNQIHTNNNGQVLTVYKADNVTIELRGNTHGGEAGASGTFTTDYTAFGDYQDGTGWVSITDQPWAHRCYRVKIVANTKMTRSDQGSPFLLVTTTYYLYADGTMRTDRTNTFQQAQKMAHWFYHMTSINPASNSSSRFLGRLGMGRKVLTPTVDFTDKLRAPVGATHTTATTGGTIPASPTGGWSVRVSALSPYGETTVSEDNTTIATTGTTSTVTANWTASTSPQGTTPKGYAVYFGYPGFERLAGTVGAGVTTLLITALPTGSAAAPPRTNTAFTGSFTVGAAASHPMADWSAIYDPQTKAVYSLAVDRDTILTHTGVTGIRGTIAMFPASIAKNYWELAMTGDGGGMPYTVPNGTVYTDTLWSFTYMPRDLDTFEDEQTVRAANVKNLGSLYPTT